MKISHRAGEWDFTDEPMSKKISRIDTEFGKAERVTHTDDILKIGAMSGCTHGTALSKKVSNIHLPWDEPNYWSYEVTAIEKRPKVAFSWKGDSGAAIFDTNGKWLGLLFGGQTKLHTEQLLTYIIPAFAILDEIRSASDGKMEGRLKI